MQRMSTEYAAGRKECVRLAMSHAAAFGFKDEVLHDAVLLVDRTMSSGIALPPAMLPLLVAACILISARQGSNDIPVQKPTLQESDSNGLNQMKHCPGDASQTQFCPPVTILSSYHDDSPL